MLHTEQSDLGTCLVTGGAHRMHTRCGLRWGVGGQTSGPWSLMGLSLATGGPMAKATCSVRLGTTALTPPCRYALAFVVLSNSHMIS